MSGVEGGQRAVPRVYFYSTTTLKFLLNSLIILGGIQQVITGYYRNIFRLNNLPPAAALWFVDYHRAFSLVQHSIAHTAQNYFFSRSQPPAAHHYEIVVTFFSDLQYLLARTACF